MSRENIEAVRASFAAFNKGDVEGWLKPAHPDIEWSSAVAAEVDGRVAVWKGKDGLRQFWEEWHAVWDMAIDVTEVRDLGDRLVVRGRMEVRGNTSGVEIAREIGYVIDFEAGLIRRAQSYLSAAEAFEAAGVPE